MKIFDIEDGWPIGISDGLILPCGDCGQKTNFDYEVTDELWNAIVPRSKKRGVICLSCLDKRAKDKGILLAHHLLQVQFTAIGETIILKPEISFVYRLPKKRNY